MLQITVGIDMTVAVAPARLSAALPYHAQGACLLYPAEEHCT